MLATADKKEELTMRFAVLSAYISLSSSLSLFDIHRNMETFFVRLLNMLYGWNLVDLNIEKANHPAIDLGDIDIGLAVQVTADGSTAKMKETISKLEKHGLNETYKKIVFVIISVQQKRNLSLNAYEINVIYLNDNLRNICQIGNEEKFNNIYEYCKSEIKSICDETSSMSLLQPGIVHSKSVTSLNGFFISNNIQFNRDGLDWNGQSIQVYYADIEALKDRLATLTENERWLIYHTLSWSINTYINDKHVGCCFLPYSWLVTRYLAIDKDWVIVMSAMECLEQENLMAYWDEGGWWSDVKQYTLSYIGNVLDLDYFSAICQHFRKAENRPYLMSTIIDCNFSHFT